jgi:hypothetical protein
MATRKTIDGQPNPKYVDLLEEDAPIAGQKFVCVSFVSPENELMLKHEYMFNKYVAQWDAVAALQAYANFTAFIGHKYKLDTATLNTDLEEFCKLEQANLQAQNTKDNYKSFLDKHEDALQEAFATEHSFQTNTRGLKIRGVYASQPEAEARAKMLREIDPNFDVYVGPVGLWMPWNPESYKTGRVEYLEEELNELMSKKKHNEDQAKEYFKARVHDTKVKAMQENIEKARVTGNKLTQTITPSGELVNIQSMTPTRTLLEETKVFNELKQ